MLKTKKNLLFFILILLIFSIIIITNNNCFASSYNYINPYQKAGTNATVVFESGDVTGDNNINIRDIIKIRKYIANSNKWNLTETEKKKADVDGNTIINIRDIIKIRKYIAAKSNSIIATKHPDWLNLYKITTNSISVTRNPTKINYKKGERLNLSGGVVTVKYSDNTTSQVPLDSSQVTVTGYNSSNLGEQTLTVKYLGETTTFTITVYTDSYYEISNNNLNNGNVILAGNKFEMYVDINVDNYQLDTSKVVIKNPDEISLSGAVVNSSNSIEKGGATISDFNVTTSGKRVTISVQTYDEINKLGYIIIDFQEGFITSNSYTSESIRYTYYVASLNASTKLSNSQVSLTTTVGVHNSFYIKNYYYGNVDTTYTENISSTGTEASTTNEFTYTNLSNSNHKITVEIIFYIDKNNQTYEKHGMISKTFSVSTNNNDVEIHYIDLHNAGSENNHGTQDSIFLKIPYGNSYKTMLIDCGKDESADAIDKYLRIDNNLVTAEKTSDNKYNCVKIDYLILTHPHSDHYGGFSGLTGITYDESSGYNENRATNKLNNQQMFYYFRNIIVGCNFYDMIGNKKVLSALYNYASNTGKLTTVTAGNVLQIENVTLNIFNPYPKENLPLEWLGDYYKGNKYFRNKEWICETGKSLRTDSSGNEIINPNGIGTNRLAQSQENNSSIVTKVIVGNGKTLLTGDITFYAEELLTGRCPLELNGDEGLAIHDKNGNATCINLIKDLKSKYNKTEEQLENTYHLSRFTKKDLSAAVLKKGHHNYWNSSSLEFLRVVNPTKIVITNNTEDDSTLKKCVDSGPITWRFPWYYKNIQKIELTDSNFSQYIYGTSNHRIISNSNGTVNRFPSFTIVSQ